mgnify:CR=1 FL=1
MQELLAVNEEFAAEVEKLYKSEEQHLAEKEELGRQLQLQQGGGQLQLVSDWSSDVCSSDLEELGRQLQLQQGGGQLQLQEERGQLELQIRRLTQALDSTKLEYQQLQDTNTRREQHLSSKQEVVLKNDTISIILIQYR